jgi:tetratricopeptide (TPR) repeat protein
MSKTEWFRRSTWTDADRQEFHARLNRSCQASNKAQYLRIQALHLAESGHPEAAIELLDQLFVEFPESIDIAQAHVQKAASLAKLGRTEAAIEEYRAALQAQRDRPNVQTNAWLDFGWFVVERALTGLYDEVAMLLEEFRENGGLSFPANEYRYAAIQALLADGHADMPRAREFAKKALAEAAKDHSGMRYHPMLGLVGAERSRFESRLRTLAGS